MSNRNRAASSILRASVLAAALCSLAYCGAASTESATAGSEKTLEVHVSAGGPVTGANVAVYAVHDETTQVLTGMGDHGVIGRGGPTDETGTAIVNLTVLGWTGPVQVVASGSSMSYPDPTVAWKDDKPGAVIQIPGAFELTSLLPKFAPGETGPVPVTLETTLADHALFAYARGLHPAHPGNKPLSTAAADRDKLFVEHVVKSQLAWDPKRFRVAIPAALTSGPIALDERAYAALMDVGLSCLARKLAADAGYETSSISFNAVTLTQLLEEDLDADGVFDGKGAGGAQVQTHGEHPISLDAQTLRLEFANELDKRFMEWPDRNKSGISRATLSALGIYDTISGDTSDLFGGAPAGSFILDPVPPSVAFAGTIPATTNAAVKVRVAASDAGQGVSAVWVRVNGEQAVQATATSTASVYETPALTLSPGPNTIVAWAVDNNQVSGEGQPSPKTATATVIFDSAPPDPTYVTDFASYYDERGLTVATSGNLAVVPVRYECSTAVKGCGKAAIPADQGIYKVASRLGWASQPTAAVLEGANPDNIPLLRWKVPYNSGTDAPISKGTFSVAVSCSGCSYPAATGDLWPSPTTADASVFLDLPISSNLIPALTSLPSAATLAVTITVTDAAGNARTADPVTVPFHLLGPPLAVVPDASYMTGTGTLSSYTVAGGTYVGMWGKGGLVAWRYTVSNPHPQPVALNYPTATWTNRETWKAHRRTFVQWFSQAGCRASPGGCAIPASESGGVTDTLAQWPSCASGSGCGDDLGGTSRTLFSGTDTGYSPASKCSAPALPSQCVAGLGDPPQDWGTVSGGASPVYSRFYYQGNEMTSHQVPDGYDYVIPAALAGTGSPAVVDVQLFVVSATRATARYPFHGEPGYAPPLPPQACFTNGVAQATYYTYVAGQNGRKGCDNTWVFQNAGYYDYQFPDEVHDEITGSWSITPRALDSGSNEIGDPAPEQAVSLNNQIPHN